MENSKFIKCAHNRAFNFKFSIKNFILLFIINQVFNEECNRERPILERSGSCVLRYCTEVEYSNGDCVISNDIIKTQRLTNIIEIGGLGFRFVNAAIDLKGNIIVLTTMIPGNHIRRFYALKSDGEYYFKKEDNTLTPFFQKNATEQADNGNSGKFESEVFFVKIAEKEYLVSQSMYYQYCELYDFEQPMIYQIKSQSILDNKMMDSPRATPNYIDNKIIFSSTSGNIIDIRKYEFTNKNIQELNAIKTLKSYVESNIRKRGKSISCLVTVPKSVICFISTEYQKAMYSYISNYTIIAFNENLEKKNSISFFSNMAFNEKSFSKCIHLKENKGLFFYYDSNSESKIFPYILIKEFDTVGSNIKNYLVESPIELNYNNVEFNMYCLLNDVIKIADSKVCFTTTSKNNETLYTILIYANEEKFIIRYYSIELYKMYNYRFLLEMKAQIYNKVISFAFSYCRQYKCDCDDDPHYSGFMIFGYPNVTNDILNLTEYLIEHRNLNDLIIYLKFNLKI